MIVPIGVLRRKRLSRLWQTFCQEKTHDMVLRYIEGRVDEAKKLQLDMLEVINALLYESIRKNCYEPFGLNVGELECRFAK